MLSSLITAARAGGDELLNYFGSVLSQTFKGSGDYTEPNSQQVNFATAADYASEQAIIASLRKDLPHVNIHSEEAGILNNHLPIARRNSHQSLPYHQKLWRKKRIAWSK